MPPSNCNSGAQAPYTVLPLVMVDYNEIRAGDQVVALIEHVYAGVGDRVLTYDGDGPDDARCNQCSGVVAAIDGRLVRIRLDWDTWR